jgi:hypothetical protein
MYKADAVVMRLRLVYNRGLDTRLTPPYANQLTLQINCGYQHILPTEGCCLYWSTYNTVHNNHVHTLLCVKLYA